MMPATPDKAALPHGFITIDEAIALINKDSRDNATVDIKWMMENILSVEKKHNFNIPLLKHENGVLKENGHVYVYVDDDVDKSNLRKAIQGHYEEMSGQRINVGAIGLRKTSTMVGKGNLNGVPMHNGESTITYGSEIKTGTFTTGGK